MSISLNDHENKLRIIEQKIQDLIKRLQSLGGK